MLAAQTIDTETALTAKAQHGDREAFSELIRSHYDAIVNVVYRMCGDASLAEDAAQETFIKAWINLSTFKPGTSMRSWLCRIGINSALDVLRRKHAEPADLDAFSLTDGAAGPEEQIVRKERASAVQRAILSLTEANRAILVLREYGDLSYSEIATALDIPSGTVMSRLNYARTRLREILAPEFGGQL